MKTSETREYLTRRITEALDGELSETERRKLERELQAHHDLARSYYEMQDLPGIKPAFEDLQPDAFAWSRLQSRLEARQGLMQWHELLSTYFRRYILTGGLAALMAVMAWNFTVDTTGTLNTVETAGEEQLLMSESNLNGFPEYQLLNELAQPVEPDAE